MSKKVNKNSQTYWKKRTDEILAHIDQMDYDYFYELQSIYSESAQQIQKEIYNFYAKYAEDNNISLQEAKKRLMGEDLSDYRANAKKYFKMAEKDPELLKRLNEQYAAGKVTRLEALNLELEYQKGVLSGNLHNSFETYLKKVADYAYKKIGGGLSASTLNKPAFEQLLKMPWNGVNYSESIWGNVDELAKDLKEVLKQGFIKGQGPADMARELRKKYNVAKGRAETIIRTDGTNVVNNATVQRYKDAGLTKYEFHAHIDSRTTPICKDHNKEIYLIEDYEPGKNAPPMHYNCRSTIIPTEEELYSEPKIGKKVGNEKFDKIDINKNNLADVDIAKNMIKRTKQIIGDYKKETGKDILSLFKDKKFGDRNNPYTDEKANFLDYLLNKTGYNKKPKSISNTDNLLKLYRGVTDSDNSKYTADKLVDEFKNGKMLISGARTSAHGRGIYMGSGDGIAKSYSGTDGKIIEAYLDNNANILDERMIIDSRSNFSKIKDSLGDDAAFYELIIGKGAMMDKNHDIFAILAGYDGISSKGVYNILNRGSLGVK
ncbi:minor capsid protein [Vagococcus fluvialis]|uniref:minor capsid protein n=1 Tax=Vagococcus fluvialis TaxID=2738 RepID=UPI0037973296